MNATCCFSLSINGLVSLVEIYRNKHRMNLRFKLMYVTIWDRRCQSLYRDLRGGGAVVDPNFYPYTSILLLVRVSQNSMKRDRVVWTEVAEYIDRFFFFYKMQSFTASHIYQHSYKSNRRIIFDTYISVAIFASSLCLLSNIIINNNNASF